jgi:hypothetical protein
VTNTILTTSQITRKAAMILHQKANFIGAMNREYDGSFAKTGAKIGDTLRVRLPNRYTTRTGIVMSAQNTVEEKVDLQVNNVIGVDLSFTSEDLALSLDDFSERILDPAMSVLAANLESAVYTLLYKKVANIVDGDAAALSFTHISQARQSLTENLAPLSKRSCILTPAHTTKFQTDTKGLFHSADNIEEQYREGIIGRTQGATFYENTIFGDHTTGTAAKSTGYTVNGTTQNGATITIQTGTTTFLVGDVVTFAGAYAVHPETKVSTGVLKKFVVTANSGSSATSLSISPSLVPPAVSASRANVSAYPDNTGAVTKVGAGASELLNGSMMFHRDAFMFATADLPLPDGTDMASRAVVDGISVSLVRDFNISDRSFPARLDVLWGANALRPELAVRIHADG